MFHVLLLRAAAAREQRLWGPHAGASILESGFQFCYTWEKGKNIFVLLLHGTSDPKPCWITVTCKASILYHFSACLSICVELEMVISTLLGPQFDRLSHFCFQGTSHQEVWCSKSADVSVSHHPPRHQRAERTKQEQPLWINLNKYAWALSSLLSPSPPCKCWSAGKR